MNVLEAIEQEEVSAGTLKEFNLETAWELGMLARDTVRRVYPTESVVIDITLISGQVLFHTVVGAKCTIDNDEWVRRKRLTVFRFGTSSWYMGQKLQLKGKTVKDGLFVSEADYACHGGSVPIRISSFNGVVGALTISGLAQKQDHDLAIQVLELFKQG
jgi:uncharacterized protein (UPF0303 family)